MSLATFGPTSTFTSVGQICAFPHHAYEAAQAEAFTGVRPFARAWMHVGTCSSTARRWPSPPAIWCTCTTCSTDHPAGALRLLLVDRPWAQAREFYPAALDAAAFRLEGLYGAAARGPLDTGTAATAVTAALLDDLDVPRALAVAEEAGGEAWRGSRCRS